MRRWWRIMVVTIVVLLIAPYLQVAADDDITGHSLEKEMREGIEIGFIKGYGEGDYRPDRDITRGEFSALIVRAMDYESDIETEKFPDVKIGTNAHQFAPYIYAASEHGIIKGHPDGTFRPEEQITREQMALMIHRVLLNEGVEVLTGKVQFTDEDQINASEEFQTAVINTFQHLIIKGHGNADDEKTRFDPKGDATRAQATAFIVRMLDTIAEDQLKDDGEEPPEDEIIDTSAYYFLGRVSSDGGIETQSTRFDSFSDADQKRSSEYPIVLKGDHVMKMDQGIVRPNPKSGSIIYIYPDERLNSPKTYATTSSAFSSEFEYLEGNDDYIKVGYGGTEGYMRKADALLVPHQIAEGKRNYYTVNNAGDLLRYYYNAGTDLFSGFNRMGPAPDFLEYGKKYYSWDGETFLDHSGNVVGEAKQYFNTMPVKSETAYSADELDDFIENGAPLGVDSPLKGHGKDFIEAQNRYGVNALYLLAKAIHESNWGRSKIAQDKNNLFGINATDDNPYGNADQFESFEASIMYLASSYVVNGYAHHADGRFNGNRLGHKGQGFNVRYASDMYWGQKIAAHMYRADQFLGSKDANRYEIKFVENNTLNVRKGPGTSHDILYTYRTSGYPVIILDDVDAPDGHTWYEITPDHKDHDTGYIRSDLLEEKTIVEH